MYNNGGHVSDWHAVGGAALQGGVTGGLAGLTGGTSLLAVAATGAASNAAGGAARNAYKGKAITAGSVLKDAAIGAAAGAGGALAGRVAKAVASRFSGAAAEGAEAGSASTSIEAGGGAKNVNAREALNSKLSALETAEGNASKVRNLPDGRTRYYSVEKPASRPSPTRGSSYVTESTPKTGRVRAWQESYDQVGKVNRVHPKIVNGQQVNAQHYPPTGKELGR